MIVELPNCPVCDADSFDRLERPTTWIGEQLFEPVRHRLGLHRCRGCSFVFVNPRPNDELLGQFYAGHDYECHEHVQPENSQYQTFDHVLDKLLALMPDRRPGRLLDFGCGGGFFVARARELGWDAVGYDIGEKAKRVCRSHGVPISDSIDELSRGEYDMITLNHVLEHIDDLPGFFRSLQKLAGPQTIVFMEVPNVESLRARAAHPSLSKLGKVDERYRAYPIHLSYFSMRTIEKLLFRHGYDIVKRYNYGVGLEELFVNREDRTKREKPEGDATRKRNGGGEKKRTGTPLATRVRQQAKQTIKATLWNLQLGENLAVAARKAR